MEYVLGLEELLLCGLALFLFSRLDYRWGTYPFLFFAPDLSMFGYLANPRIGAWTYNLVHHKGLSVTLYILGYLLSIPWLIFAGTLLLDHSSLDRVLGYGLKYPDAFQIHTWEGLAGNVTLDSWSTPRNWRRMDKPTYYEIRVKGHLDASWADTFDGLTITNLENGDALLSGSIQDQAALQGFLRRISNLGLILISVNPVAEDKNNEKEKK